MKNYLKIDKNFQISDAILKSKGIKKRNNNLLNANNLNIGAYLIIPILFGLLIGYNLDKYFKTKSLFILIFILVGTIGSFYNLFKLIKE